MIPLNFLTYATSALSIDFPENFQPHKIRVDAKEKGFLLYALP